MAIPAHMTIFITSFWGMYIAQSFIHSIIASVIAECAILSWNIRAPHIKQWFRFMVIFLSLTSFPIYQFLVPRRGDVYFRLSSLLDSNRWFFIERWGSLPVLIIFFLILSITALIFIIQELVPILSHLLGQMRSTEQNVHNDIDSETRNKASTALEGLPFDKELIEIIDDDDLTLFSSTGLKPMIYVSTGLIRSFSMEHLQVAFAHEVAHIQRSRRPVLIFTYLLRVLLFFNPVAMIEFRRLAHEEEKVCDDIAIELTGKPESLSEAIEMLRPAPEDYNAGAGDRGAERLVSALEYYSHDVLLRSRAARIGHRTQDTPFWGVPVMATMALIVCVNYFIV
jgi:Zn-dependent protease with chaperone function